MSMNPKIVLEVAIAVLTVAVSIIKILGKDKK